MCQTRKYALITLKCIISNKFCKKFEFQPTIFNFEPLCVGAGYSLFNRKICYPNNKRIQNIDHSYFVSIKFLFCSYHHEQFLRILVNGVRSNIHYDQQPIHELFFSVGRVNFTSFITYDTTYTRRKIILFGIVNVTSIYRDYLTPSPPSLPRSSFFRNIKTEINTRAKVSPNTRKARFISIPDPIPGNIYI